MFRVRAQAVRAAVFCRERGLLLADEVGLNRKPVTVVVPIGLIALRKKKRRSEQ